MRRLPHFLSALALAAVLTSGPALAQGGEAPPAERHAIVIGNAAYENVAPLANAAADARAMAEFLRAHGFRVIEGIDVDKAGFEDILRRVVTEIPEDAEVVFYYAGHGIQMGRRNYILPVDASFEAPTDTPFETVTLDHIVEILAGRSRLQLIILDSCRNNPFTEAKMLTEIDATLYEAQDGFSRMTAPLNSLIAFATSPGFVAYDGNAGNSPYTSALVRIGSEAAEEDILAVFGKVRQAVYEATGGAQTPSETSTLVEPFRFAPVRGVTFVGSADPDLVPTPVPEAIPETGGDGTGGDGTGGDGTGGDGTGGDGTGPEVAGGDGTGPAGTGVVLLGRDLGAAPVAVAGSAESGLALSGRLERRLALGAGLLSSLTLAEGDTITITGGASHGGLVLEGAASPVYAGTPLSPADLAALIYEVRPTPRRIAGPASDYVATEALGIRIASAGGTVLMDAAMTLAPDPCDYEAGDWLDPNGTGLARYPNEIDPAAALAACTAAVAADPENGRFHYQLGRAAQAARDYGAARAAFERAAELGHVRAFHALGDLADVSATAEGGLAAGSAGPEALALYEKGVAAGDPYAMHALGKQYLRYGTDELQRRYGFDLLSRAVELGHTFAMNELGFYFIREGSPDYQPERGLRYLEESAARGDIYGFQNLGLAHENGWAGLTADPRAAAEWYAKAASGGHPYAPLNLGLLHFGGKLGAPDPVAALGWYDEALARGVAWGGANGAAIIAAQGTGGLTPADAALRAAKAMALGDAEAGAAAAGVLAGLAERDVNKATQMLLAELGETLAIDGAIGPETRGIIERRMQAAGAGAVPRDARERAVAVARLYWAENSFRVDLY